MRATTLTMLLTLASTLPAAAQDKAKPNTLTPKEIADGWILLFDGATTFGWQADGEIGASDSWFVAAGGKTGTIAEYTTQFPGKCTVKYEAYVITEADGANTVYLWELGKDGDWHGQGIVAGKLPKLQSIVFNPEWRASKSSVKVHVPPDVKVFIRSIKLRCSADTKPLFNGKDLDGWKAFPGKKSEFTVEDGAIHLKNGPGDLQTEGKYANFVLQLECKSNGKHLNSGVFFRCKANEYQNGYEAQIHNNFTGDPAKEYTVEEFDPKTHELVEKKKVKSAATDYGTGAIYRRVPARSGVAKDGEWFTMTIVAHGNHFATWVNGIQQVDWYDNRPASDNPRTGFRKEAGHISIQGHDPTTDLSFRNIRIAELPN
jgi:hypothetical protein